MSAPCVNKINKTSYDVSKTQKKVNNLTNIINNGNYYINRLVPKGKDKKIGIPQHPFENVYTNNLITNFILPSNGKELIIGSKRNINKMT